MDIRSDRQKGLSYMEPGKKYHMDPRTAIAECDKTAAELRSQYDKVLSWAGMFAGSSMEGKKMIVRQLIEQVRIFRNYKIENATQPSVCRSCPGTGIRYTPALQARASVAFS